MARLPVVACCWFLARAIDVRDLDPWRIEKQLVDPIYAPGTSYELVSVAGFVVEPGAGRQDAHTDLNLGRVVSRTNQAVVAVHIPLTATSASLGGTQYRKLSRGTETALATVAEAPSPAAPGATDATPRTSPSAAACVPSPARSAANEGESHVRLGVDIEGDPSGRRPRARPAASALRPSCPRPPRTRHVASRRRGLGSARRRALRTRGVMLQHV